MDNIVNFPTIEEQTFSSEPKYSVGDRIVINIRGINESALFGPDGRRSVICYQIDDAEDGTSRSISQEVLDTIIAIGGDLYSVKKYGMS